MNLIIAHDSSANTTVFTVAGQLPFSIATKKLSNGAYDFALNASISSAQGVCRRSGRLLFRRRGGTTKVTFDAAGLVTDSTVDPGLGYASAFSAQTANFAALATLMQ